MWHIWFWWGNLRERDHMKDQDIDEKYYTNLKQFGRKDMGWIDLTQDVTMALRLYKMWVIS
jgi:hypothetical protein